MSGPIVRSAPSKKYGDNFSIAFGSSPGDAARADGAKAAKTAPKSTAKPTKKAAAKKAAPKAKAAKKSSKK